MKIITLQYVNQPHFILRWDPHPSGSPSVVPGPAASVSPGNWLEMQIPRPSLRPNERGSLRTASGLSKCL